MSIITYLNVLNKNTYPKLKLCKPNRTVIHPLKDIYGLQLSIRLGDINQISFTIPTKVEVNHQLVDNPLVDLIKDRYYAYMFFYNQVEYFLFLDKNKEMSKDGNTITYTAYSCGIELADKDVRSYEEVSKNLTTHIRNVLSETEWKVDYVDSKFDLLYRTYEMSVGTALQAVIEIAEKFNALIVWDTLNRKINFHQPNNIGLNRGLKAKQGRLLDTLSVTTNADEMVTRLKVYGYDGLEFRNISPTGSNYIEDFSYFMFPFQCDENYNVIKSSDYMSDELCIAITKYKKKIELAQGQFATLRQQKTNKQSEITTREQELEVLENELKMLKDERDVINYTYSENATTREDWLDVISRINTKNTQITNKKNQLNTSNNQMNTINNAIRDLEISLKVENNYTPQLILELNKFIITKDYTNDSIIDEKELLEEAIEVFETLNEPVINTSVSLQGYVDTLDSTMNLEMVSIGDIIRVENDELRVKLKLKVIEINLDFDNDDIKLNIANGKEIVDENGKLVNMIYSTSSTSTTVDMEKYTYRQGKDAMDGVTQILNSEFDTAKNILTGGVDSTIEISERGIYNRDYDDPNTYMVINAGQLIITPDSGNSVSVAISKNGCVKEKILHKTLDRQLEVLY